MINYLCMDVNPNVTQFKDYFFIISFFLQNLVVVNLVLAFISKKSNKILVILSIISILTLFVTKRYISTIDFSPCDAIFNESIYSEMIIGGNNFNINNQLLYIGFIVFILVTYILGYIIKRIKLAKDKHLKARNWNKKKLDNIMYMILPIDSIIISIIVYLIAKLNI